jgi:polysaccharide deacetylase 2 family uncharacterized protein YibQ
MTANKRTARRTGGKAVVRKARKGGLRLPEGPALRTLLAAAVVAALLIVAVLLRPADQPRQAAVPTRHAATEGLPPVPPPPPAAAPAEPEPPPPVPPSLQPPALAAPAPAAAAPKLPAPPRQVAAVSPGLALPPKGTAPSGTPAWVRNAVPAPSPNGHPRIVIVIDDMGLDRPRSARAVALPGPLTLSYLPYGRELAEQTATARAHGHELMMHIPMEPDGHDDPGPDALVTALPPAEVRRRLQADLAAFDGYTGINNHMGSRFTANAAGMAEVMAELGARGLLFLDSRTTPATRGPEMAQRYDVPLAQRDIFLDHDMSAAAVEKSLEKVEATARRNGVAIAIGHPHDVTLAALARWLPTLQAKGFQLVPLTAVVRSPAAGRAAG